MNLFTLDRGGIMVILVSKRFLRFKMARVLTAPEWCNQTHAHLLELKRFWNNNGFSGRF